MPPRTSERRALSLPHHRSASPPRVVITGAGIVTALGIGWQRKRGRVSAPAAPRSARCRSSMSAASGSRLAAEVDLPAALPPTRLTAAPDRPAGPRQRDAAARRPRSLAAGRLGARRRSAAGAGHHRRRHVPRRGLFPPARCKRPTGTASSPPARCTTRRRPRPASSPTPWASAGRSPSSPTPAPPAPTPSATPGNSCGAARPSACLPAATTP